MCRTSPFLRANCRDETNNSDGERAITEKVQHALPNTVQNGKEWKLLISSVIV